MAEVLWFRARTPQLLPFVWVDCGRRDRRRRLELQFRITRRPQRTSGRSRELSAARPSMVNDRCGNQSQAAPAGSDGWARERMLAIASHGDRQAFAELFAWFAPRIKAFMMRGGASADMAEEVAQEAMIAVWRRASTFDPSLSRPVTWIYTIARNRRIDIIRRERRIEATLEEMRPLQDRQEPGSDNAIIAVETGDQVQTSISTLGADQLEVIRKAFFEEKSHTEIAAELHLPLGTVKSRIRHALIHLRAALKGDG